MTYQYNEIILNDDRDASSDHKHTYDKIFMLDFVILLISPIPFYDTYLPIRANGNIYILYYHSEIAFALMWLRMALFIRACFNYSMYTDPYSRKLCNFYGCDASVWFTLKCHIKTNPGYTIMILFGFTIIFLAYLLRIFEMPYWRLYGEWPLMDQYFYAFWVTTISITTTGYGDFCPSTIIGQYLTLFLAIWGAFLLSLLYGIMETVFVPDEKQMMALSHI
jgi:hypothetical protein